MCDHGAAAVPLCRGTSAACAFGRFTSADDLVGECPWRFCGRAAAGGWLCRGRNAAPSAEAAAGAALGAVAPVVRRCRRDAAGDADQPDRARYLWLCAEAAERSDDPGSDHRVAAAYTTNCCRGGLLYRGAGAYGSICLRPPPPKHH